MGVGNQKEKEIPIKLALTAAPGNLRFCCHHTQGNKFLLGPSADAPILETLEDAQGTICEMVNSVKQC